MRKNISINISGIIFHIEEDGYDQLKQYLESINRYFSTFEDSKEIISDIESRIAEIFLSKLKDGNQIIKGEDVEALIATMGSVADFEAIEEQGPTISQEQSKRESPPKVAAESPRPSSDKKLYRDNRRKILGGVAAGIAHYLGIDPLWIRLILLILFFNVFFNFPISGVILVAYILAWIIVPNSNDLEEDQKIKKLYRNSEDRVLGGIASGIAAYFGADTTLIRLLFVLSIFLGGSGLVIYIILWIITPEAKTLTEKMQMQGEPVTLSNIETNLKKSFNVDEGEENAFVKILLFPFRLLALIFTGLGKALGPFLLFLVEAIRVVAGVAIAIVGLSMIFSLMMVTGLMVGVISAAHVTWDLPIPFELIRGSVPIAASIAAFFSALIPALFLTLVGVMLIAKQKVINATIGWSLFAAWIISVLVFSFTLPSFLYDFTTEGTYQETSEYDLGKKIAILKLRDLGDHKLDFVNLALRGYSGNHFKLETNITSKGGSREEAKENAKMVDYQVALEDSVFWFDSNLQFKDKSQYRFQEVHLVLFIPFERPFIMQSDLDQILTSRRYASRTGDDSWIFTESGMECISCAGPGSSFDEDEDYGPRGSSRVFEMGQFENLDITGNFQVNILAGDQYEVLIGGRERYFEDLRVENEDGTLIIDGGEYWNMRSRTRRLTIDVRAPQVTAISIEGSAQAEMRDFDRLESLTIIMGGKTEALIEGEIDQLEIELESASSLVLRGSGQQLIAELSAAAKLDAFDYTVDEAVVVASGASNAKVFVSEDLSVESSGVSNVLHRGTANVHIDQSGSGTVREDN